MLYGYLPAILGGLALTLQVAALSLLIAMLFGLAGAFAKLSDNRLLRGLAGTYTTVIRGVPELVLMLIIFYGGQGAINSLTDRMGLGYLDIDPFIAGTITLGFIFGAYLSETFRGAILAIPAGQLEAGAAFGLSGSQVFRRITGPQMVRHALPGFANTWLVMVKATAIVSLIGLDDMMHRANLASSTTQKPFVFYASIALIYLGITTVSTILLSTLERRFSLGQRKADF